MSGKAYAWNRGFICEVCRLTRLDRVIELRPDLAETGWARDRRRRLMRAANVIRSRAWSDGSWGAMAYHLQRVIAFERDSGIPVLPMGTEGMMLYFTHLSQTTPTWRAIRSARTAIRAWHIVAGLPDPFLHPDRAAFLVGLKRTVTLASRKKLPMTIEHVLTMLVGLFSDRRCSRRLALRDAAWLIIGFFGFRRHSEVIFSDRPGQEMGLRRRDVTFFPATRRVRLWIRRMKNDPYGKGHAVWLCDTTTSGVPIYDLLFEYAGELHLPPDSPAPFLQGKGKGGLFLGRKLCHYRSRLKLLMRRYLPHFSEAQLRDYSAHSLRRGGVTHAYRMLGPSYLDLINVHGSWLGGASVTGYRYPSDDQLVSVTAAM